MKVQGGTNIQKSTKKMLPSLSHSESTVAGPKQRAPQQHFPYWGTLCGDSLQQVKVVTLGACAASGGAVVG